MTERHILNLVRLPARLTEEQVADLLNCKPDSIRILVREKLLKPLGSPRHNATKYFSTPSIEKLVKEEEFLNEVTKAIYRAVQTKNQNAGARVSFAAHAEAA